MMFGSSSQPTSRGPRRGTGTGGGHEERPPLIRLRLTDLHTTMVPPIPHLSDIYQPPIKNGATSFAPGELPKKVPVTRIFGKTQAGQSVCCNIHGIWPYFFVEYPEERSLAPDKVWRYTRNLTFALNAALSVRRGKEGAGDGETNENGKRTKSMAVASVMVVKGIPFYGFSVGYNYFLKISLVSPGHINRCKELLKTGRVLQRKFKVFEAHLASNLQFMIDFDLYGCGWLDLDGGYFRLPLPEGDPYDHSEEAKELFNNLTVSDVHLHPAAESPNRDSYAQVEIDVFPYHIMNRRKLFPRYLHDSLHEYLHPESIDPDAKHVRSVGELWAEEERRRIERGLDPKNGIMPPTDERKPRSGVTQEDNEWKGGDWDASERNWSHLQQRIANERKDKNYHKYTHETLGQPISVDRARWDKFIWTTFDSTEVGWPDQERTVRKPGNSQIPPTRQSQSSPLKGGSGVEPLGGLVEEGEGEDMNPFELFNESQKPSSLEVVDDDERRRIEEETLAFAEANPDFWNDDINFSLPQVFEGLDDADREFEAILKSQKEGQKTTQEPQSEEDRESWKSSQFKGDGFEDDEEDNELLPRLTQLYHKRQRGNVFQTPVKRDRQRSTSPGTPTKYGMTPRSGSKLNPYYSANASTGVPSPTRSSQQTTPSKNRFAERRNVSPSPLKRKISQSGVLMDAREEEFGGRSQQSISTYDNDDNLDDLPDYIFDASEYQVNPRNHANDAGPAAKINGNKDSGTILVAIHNGQTDLKTPQSCNHHFLEQKSSSKQEKTPVTSRFPDDDELFHLEPTLKSSFRPQTASTLSPHLPASQTIVSLATSERTPQTEKTQKRARFTSPDGSHLNLRAIEASQSAVTLHPSGSTADPSLSMESISTNSVFSDRPPPELISKNCWKMKNLPIRKAEVVATIHPEVVHSDPFYSDERDFINRWTSFGVRTYKVKHSGLSNVPNFPVQEVQPGDTRRRRRPITEWTYTAGPPPRGLLVRYAAKEKAERYKQKALDTRKRLASQLGAPTQLNKYGYKLNRKRRAGNGAQRETQPMTSLSIEIFATSKGRLVPDPKTDQIRAIFYCYHDEANDELDEYPGTNGYHTGILLLDHVFVNRSRIAMSEIPIEWHDDELDLINSLIEKVRIWDPDILAGWDVHNASWGYLWQRTRSEFGMSLTDELSRLRFAVWHPGGDSSYNGRHTTNLFTCGRQIFNIWRIFRGEFQLTSYTFENLAFEILHQRFPYYHPSTLTSWYNSKVPDDVNRVLQYFVSKVNMYTEMLEAAETITKTAEFARVFGVDFGSVLKRGSQFKVESFMFRIAKPESFLLISPTREEVAKQNAAEAQPLIFEPDSQFYKDPVIVLDFASLYPSIMIAYNMCYSTCLGKVDRFKGTQKLGWDEIKLPPGMLELLQDDITIAANGVMFAKKALRRGLLDKMLTEILDTRVMVKQGMKLASGDSALRQVLNARQLGLKLMANVTYGYAGASFSGRMPCVEIADAIVQTGRETLEKAVKMIEGNAKWDAKVAYGDTDSLFVVLPGRSKETAFRIGYEIAEAVTAVNPKPVKLKFEKVYEKCLLLSKKRYVGLMWENPDDKEPVLEAKGIEIIRRDGFPALQKMEDAILKMLFRTHDVSEIKKYCIDEWTKMLDGRVSIQDFVIAQEVKLGAYSENAVPLPGVAVAARRIAEDPNDEVNYGERVPYCIVQHESKHRLVDRAVAPEELLLDRSLRLDMLTYIRKMINPLNRVLNLIGVDCQPWFQSMPRKQRATSHHRSIAAKPGVGQKGAGVGMGQTLDTHFSSVHCLVCGQQTANGDVCEKCSTDDLPISLHTLLSRFHLAESRRSSAHRICSSCSGTPLAEPIKCDSIDCPIMYARVKAEWGVSDVVGIPRLVQELDEMEENRLDMDRGRAEGNGLLEEGEEVVEVIEVVDDSSDIEVL